MIKDYLFTVAHATTTNTLNNIHTPTGKGTDTTLADVFDSVQSVITMLFSIIGFLAAVYFLYGAFLYIISMGNDSKATKAKQTMIWALIGLVVAILGRVMVGLIYSTFAL